MSTFTDKIFSFKSAYEFESIPDLTLEDYLYKELVYQLQQLEEQWVKLDLEKLGKNRTFSQEIKYRSSLEIIRFRLEETLRFLSQNNGPRIVHFVISELLDFLNELGITQQSLSAEDLKNVEHILIVMNSFIQPEVFKLKSISQSEVAERLKDAVEKLLNRFSGKNREESLKTLKTSSVKESNGN
ncbi:MAG: hypothetical protein MJE63_23025 [Proteobacteria bacterium]|nr:hypothetical protein [Pseudomonadota bacterium]